MEKLELYQNVVRLFKQHGLDKEWYFQLKNTKNQLGCCDYRTKTIQLQQYFVQNNPSDKVIDVLLHEIAHALTPGHKHDFVFKLKAMQIGCTQFNCQNTDDIKTPPSKYNFPCQRCGKIHGWNRVPKHYSYKCKCGGSIKTKHSPLLDMAIAAINTKKEIVQTNNNTNFELEPQ